MCQAEVGRRELEDGLRTSCTGLVVTGGGPLSRHCNREPAPRSVPVSVSSLVENVMFAL